MFTFSVVVVDLPTDCILSFLFPAQTDVLVPVFSQSTDVVVVNFVVFLKFPIVADQDFHLRGRGGGGSHPDPEIRRRQYQKKFFSALRASV